MKVTKLVIKSIGKITDETIPLDRPLILFYGEIRQGKSIMATIVGVEEGKIS
jgi:pantothenate kinase-related protein Tda10